jgi:hypothetical protein
MLTETSMKAVPIPPTETYWAYGFPAMCLAVFGADTLFPALLVLVAHSTSIAGVSSMSLETLR